MTLENEINTEIARTRTNALYKSGITGLIGITMIMFYFVIFSWGDIGGNILIIWISAFLFMVFLRLALTYKYRKAISSANIKIEQIEKWEKYFYYSLLLTGALWGSIAFLPFNDNYLSNLLFVTIVMITLSGSSIALYSHSYRSMITYLFITLVPVSIMLLLVGEKKSVIVAIAIFTFLAMMVKITRGLNITLLDNIRLGIVNRNMSLRDPLTGLGNRRRLEIFVEKLIPISARKNNQFSVVLMDIDHFKKYNDENGHHAGDVLLCAVSEIITDEIRSSDLAIRFGGEEFLVLMPETEIEQAFAIAQRISAEIMETTDVTISGGVARHKPSENFEDTVRRADNALYLAKRNGRDLIEMASDSILD
ncbi:MAG: GGDEF domain-containing protein [Rhodospirillaceae bacterium]|nr:GGDEF domain-containing protein [Rhodospirillaceae bacterium]